jgi:hypothetical protein
MTNTPLVGKPEKRGAGWFVPSGAVGYLSFPIIRIRWNA